MMEVASTNITGVILAGGLARRMGGGDKGLIEIDAKPLLSHVIERLTPQVKTLILNANGDAARFSEYGLPVVPDPVPGAQGPLAGVLAGLEWAQAHSPESQWILTVASDTPFFPDDLVMRLLEAVKRDGADMANAASNGRVHPVFGLWPIRLAGDLRKSLIEDEIRKVDIWTGKFKCAQVAFSAENFDPFFNVNRPEDVEKLREFHKQVPA